jgi:hypothetical protein
MSAGERYAIVASFGAPRGFQRLDLATGERDQITAENWSVGGPWAISAQGDRVYLSISGLSLEGGIGRRGVLEFKRSADGEWTHREIESLSGESSSPAYAIELTPDEKQVVFQLLAPNEDTNLFLSREASRISATIAESSDDALEQISSPSLTDANAGEALLERNHIVGLRFDGLPLLRAAEVDSARLLLSPTADNATPRALLIETFEEGDLAPFQDGAEQGISNRRTSRWSENEPVASQDLSSLVNTLLASSSWSEGGALALRLSGHGRDAPTPHRAWMFDGNPELAPRLELLIYEDDAELERRSFDDWLSGRVAEGSRPEDDPDGDGLSLGVEYAFGLSPTARDAMPTPGLEVEEGGSVTLSFDRWPAHTSATVAVEVSEDLDSWRTVVESAAGASPVASLEAAEVLEDFANGDGSNRLRLAMEPVAAGSAFRFRVTVL